MTAYKLLNFMVPLADERSAIKRVNWRKLQRVGGCLDEAETPTLRVSVSVVSVAFFLSDVSLLHNPV